MANFAKQMQRLADKTKRAVDATVVDVVTELAQTIMFRTPIGDPTLWESAPPPGYKPGTLINSWNSQINTQDGSVVRSPNAFAKDALAQLDTAALLAPGNVFYFVNPTKYANRIEFTGHSTQAPAGMVRLTVRNFGTIVKRVAARNK